MVQCSSNRSGIIGKGSAKLDEIFKLGPALGGCTEDLAHYCQLCVSRDLPRVTPAKHRLPTYFPLDLGTETSSPTTTSSTFCWPADSAISRARPKWRLSPVSTVRLTLHAHTYNS